MRISIKTASAILATTGSLLAGSAYAMNFGDMMNPSKWMGGSHDRDDYYRGGPGYGYPGWGGYPGYGYPGWGGYPGYGYPGYGYPGYGYPGYGRGSSAPIIITPQGGSKQAAPTREIE